MEYRIDDLARAANTTTRNVRAYQERGLLPPPVGRAGRAAIYDDTHLGRLKVIDALLERGFTTAHISHFFTSWETGKDLTEVLGLQRAVTEAWGDPTTLDVPRALVDTFLGADDAELLDQLIDMGLARLKDDMVTFTQPQLLDTFAELRKYGMRLRDLIDVFRDVNRHVDDIADGMVKAGRKFITAQHGRGWLPADDAEIAMTTSMLNQMRDLAVVAVHTTLAHSLDHAVQTQLTEYLSDVLDQSGVANAEEPE